MRDSTVSIGATGTAALVLAALAATAPIGWAAAEPSRAAAQAGAAGEAAAGFDQRGVHEHGRVTVNLALEGRTLSLELEAPAINVTGFEREPRTAEEKSVVARVDGWLRSGAGLLAVPAAARCRRESVEYTPPRLDARKPAGEHAHDEHDHAHEHEHDEKTAETHSDYVARYTFTCLEPGALAWAELTLLQRLLKVEGVQVNLVTPQGQRQLRLAPSQSRIPLR